MNSSICLSIKELRAIIQGKRVYIKCPDCSSVGSVPVDFTEHISPYTGTILKACETRSGIGYIVRVYENDY